MVTPATLLEARTYSTKKPDLEYRLTSSLTYSPSRAYILTGDNGTGKTTFLERIVLPALARLGLQPLYIGADLHVAQPTIVSGLALSQAVRELRSHRSRSPLYDPESASWDKSTRAGFSLLNRRANIRAIAIDEVKTHQHPLVLWAASQRKFLILVTQNPPKLINILDLKTTLVTHSRFERNKNSVSIIVEGTRFVS